MPSGIAFLPKDGRLAGIASPAMHPLALRSPRSPTDFMPWRAIVVPEIKICDLVAAKEKSDG
jgi:hypothetical protein